MLRASLLCILAFFFSALAEDAAPAPRKITLSSRVAPLGKSLKKRQLAPANIPLADFFKGTDLQWFGNITVGTPPQDITVVFDTGSSTLEFASTLCSTCSSQVQFDPSKSSTFVDGGTNSTITFGTGIGVDPVFPGNEYQLQLRSAFDTVSVGGYSSPNVSLFLITEQTPTFDIDPFSGIQGMGPSAQGFFAALINRGLPSLFSLLLAPEAVGNAELTIGGIDESKFNGSLTFADQAGEGHWELLSSEISVNGQTTSLLNTERNIIFDSGTSNIVFDTDITNAMYALISPEIQPNPAEPGSYGIACSLIPTLPAVIDVTFTSQEGNPFNLTIPSSELNVGPFANNASLCQTLINAFDGLNLVGASLLKHYYSVWDIGNQRMGFAPTV